MSKNKPQRFSAKMTYELVIDLIKGMSLDKARRGVVLTNAANGKVSSSSTGFQARSTSSEDLSQAREKELKSKIDNLVIKAEFLEEKIDRLEGEKGSLVFNSS